MGKRFGKVEQNVYNKLLFFFLFFSFSFLFFLFFHFSFPYLSPLLSSHLSPPHHTSSWQRAFAFSLFLSTVKSTRHAGDGAAVAMRARAVRKARTWARGLWGAPRTTRCWATDRRVYQSRRLLHGHGKGLVTGGAHTMGECTKPLGIF